MALNPNEVYYNIYYKKEYNIAIGQFYIGNGKIFLRGVTIPDNGSKYELIIEFITALRFDNNEIHSNSYSVIMDRNQYNSAIQAMNINEMVKLWNKYKTYVCDNQHAPIHKFQTIGGTVFNKYNPFSLVDNIICNKHIKMEDMQYVPFTYELRNKINCAYGKKIFILN